MKDKWIIIIIIIKILLLILVMFYKFIHYKFIIKHEKFRDIYFSGSIKLIKIDISINTDTCESQRWQRSMYLKHLEIRVVHLHLKIINNHCHSVKGDPFISAAWPQDIFSIIFLQITYFFWSFYQFKQFLSFSMKCCLYKDFSNKRYAISS